MDLAQNLVRSVARAFYTQPEDRRMILIIDALVFHTTIRDDDLSLLMKLNSKDLSKICGKVREDHLLHVHSRPEIREGKEKASLRTYYYIDYRQAVDAIKYRTFMLDKKVQGDTNTQQEKKEYFCRRCDSEWTMLEVVDNSSEKGFLCHKCGALLDFDPNRMAGGHQVSTKLNNQLKFIIEVLPKLDTMTIPEFDFEKAHAASIPVIRDRANQVAASTVVDSLSKPTAVRGMANTGPQSIAVSITDKDGPTEAEREAERLQKEEKANANALPSWHKTSNSGLSYEGAKNATPASKDDDYEVKKPDESNTDNTYEQEIIDVGTILLKSAEEEARLKALEARDTDEEQEEDESEGEEFVDISANVSSVGEKRNASSGPTSAADTPASDRPAKKVRVEEPAEDSEDDEDDLQFEDV
ncbi:hypothetical protein M426DRAFT_320082 [Hypoxylon sp. CI-4A]|nr:hypothetical protein M426DRAFT_320082 [Hypoxylon sp. CI-4A]